MNIFTKLVKMSTNPLTNTIELRLAYISICYLDQDLPGQTDLGCLQVHRQVRDPESCREPDGSEAPAHSVQSG